MSLQDEELQVKEFSDKFRFKAYREKFGVADFHIGVRREEKGVISAVYFIPDQQPDEDFIYKYVSKREHTRFSVETWTHKADIDDVSHCGTHYCGYHDLVEERWVMPRQADYIEVDEYGTGIQIGIRRDRGDSDDG